MRHVHGGTPVSIDASEGDLAVTDERVNVKDLTRAVLFERHDAINLLWSPNLAHGVDEKLRAGVVRQRDDVVQTFARPVFVENPLLRHEDDAATLSHALAHELHAFEIARQADKGWRTRWRFTHHISGWLTAHQRHWYCAEP